MTRSGHGGTGGWLRLFGAAALVVVVVGLASQNRTLSRQLSEAKNELAVARAAAAGHPILKVGESVGSLRAVDDEGKTVQVFGGIQSGDGREVLVFVASPTCGACEAEHGFWHGLVLGADQARLRCVCVVSNAGSDSIAKFADSGCETLAVPNSKLSALAELPVVPSVIHVGPDGMIRALWLGVPSAEGRAEIEAVVKAR